MDGNCRASGLRRLIIYLSCYTTATCFATTMEGNYLQQRVVSSSVEPDNASWPVHPALSSANATAPRASALSNKLTSVLSTSYTDPEIRDALQTLDKRGLKNSAETRRRLRLNLQKEVIEYNGDIIEDFGVVAEVGLSIVRSSSV